MPKRLIWLDFVILLKTVRVVWKGEGEKERRSIKWERSLLIFDFVSNYVILHYVKIHNAMIIKKGKDG